jgi:hypothetical protein
VTKLRPKEIAGAMTVRQLIEQLTALGEALQDDPVEVEVAVSGDKYEVITRVVGRQYVDTPPRSGASVVLYVEPARKKFDG